MIQRSRSKTRLVLVLLVSAPAAFWACGDDASVPSAMRVLDDASVASASAADASAPETSTPAADAAPVPAEASVDAGANRPYDWVGIIGTGQSLSVGAYGSPPVNTTQPFRNLMLADEGPDPKFPIDADVGASRWVAVPLTEPVRGLVGGYDASNTLGQYPNDIQGETPHSGMANTLSAMWAAQGGAGDYVTVHSVVGWSGACLVEIDQDGGYRAYPASLNEARVFTSLAHDAGKTIGYGGIILTHGECDAFNPYDGSYGAQLHELWQGYNADLRAITGQTRNVALFASQESTTTGDYQNPSPAVQLWQASQAHPGEIICTGPRYPYAYQSDDTHLSAPGYERLGEKYAEVFDQVVDRGNAWKPLQPIAARLAGSTITVDFDVPVPPLTWDTNVPLAHRTKNTEWASGRGFEVVDSAETPVTIASVAIAAASVIIELASAPPTGSQLTVGYALTSDDAGARQPKQILQGQLRDSDDFVGWDAETLSVHVTSGSALVTGTAPGQLARRTAWDDVAGAGIVAGTIILPVFPDAGTDASTILFADQITLSHPWTGPSGTATLSFHHDEHNYAVHFALPVQ